MARRPVGQSDSGGRWPTVAILGITVVLLFNLPTILATSSPPLSTETINNHNNHQHQHNNHNATDSIINRWTTRQHSHSLGPVSYSSSYSSNDGGGISDNGDHHHHNHNHHQQHHQTLPISTSFGQQPQQQQHRSSAASSIVAAFQSLPSPPLLSSASSSSSVASQNQFVKPIVLFSDLANHNNNDNIKNVSTYNNNNNNNKYDFYCATQFGYYRDPGNCSSYFICTFGLPLHKNCSKGLYFSERLQTCDWPSNVPCEQDYASLNAETSMFNLIDDPKSSVTASPPSPPPSSSSSLPLLPFITNNYTASPSSNKYLATAAPPTPPPLKQQQFQSSPASTTTSLYNPGSLSRPSFANNTPQHYQQQHRPYTGQPYIPKPSSSSSSLIRSSNLRNRNFSDVSSSLNTLNKHEGSVDNLGKNSNNNKKVLGYPSSVTYVVDGFEVPPVSASTTTGRKMDDHPDTKIIYTPYSPSSYPNGSLGANLKFMEINKSNPPEQRQPENQQMSSFQKRRGYELYWPENGYLSISDKRANPFSLSSFTDRPQSLDYYDHKNHHATNNPNQLTYVAGNPYLMDNNDDDNDKNRQQQEDRKRKQELYYWLENLDPSLPGAKHRARESSSAINQNIFQSSGMVLQHNQSTTIKPVAGGGGGGLLRRKIPELYLSKENANADDDDNNNDNYSPSSSSTPYMAENHEHNGNGNDGNGNINDNNENNGDGGANQRLIVFGNNNDNNNNNNKRLNYEINERLLAPFKQNNNNNNHQDGIYHKIGLIQLVNHMDQSGGDDYNHHQQQNKKKQKNAEHDNNMVAFAAAAAAAGLIPTPPPTSTTTTIAARTSTSTSTNRINFNGVNRYSNQQSGGGGNSSPSTGITSAPSFADISGLTTAARSVHNYMNMTGANGRFRKKIVRKMKKMNYQLPEQQHQQQPQPGQPGQPGSTTGMAASSSSTNMYGHPSTHLLTGSLVTSTFQNGQIQKNPNQLLKTIRLNSRPPLYEPANEDEDGVVGKIIGSTPTLHLLKQWQNEQIVQQPPPMTTPMPMIDSNLKNSMPAQRMRTGPQSTTLLDTLAHSTFYSGLDPNDKPESIVVVPMFVSSQQQQQQLNEKSSRVNPAQYNSYVVIPSSSSSSSSSASSNGKQAINNHYNHHHHHQHPQHQQREMEEISLKLKELNNTVATNKRFESKYKATDTGTGTGTSTTTTTKAPIDTLEEFIRLTINDTAMGKSNHNDNSGNNNNNGRQHHQSITIPPPPSIVVPSVKPEKFQLPPTTTSGTSTTTTTTTTTSTTPRITPTRRPIIISPTPSMISTTSTPSPPIGLTREQQMYKKIKTINGYRRSRKYRPLISLDQQVPVKRNVSINQRQDYYIMKRLTNEDTIIKNHTNDKAINLSDPSTISVYETLKTNDLEHQQHHTPPSLMIQTQNPRFKSTNNNNNNPHQYHHHHHGRPSTTTTPNPLAPTSPLPPPRDDSPPHPPVDSNVRMLPPYAMSNQQASYGDRTMDNIHHQHHNHHHQHHRTSTTTVRPDYVIMKNIDIPADMNTIPALSTTKAPRPNGGSGSGKKKMAIRVRTKGTTPKTSTTTTTTTSTTTTTTTTPSPLPAPGPADRNNNNHSDYNYNNYNYDYDNYDNLDNNSNDYEIDNYDDEYYNGLHENTVKEMKRPSSTTSTTTTSTTTPMPSGYYRRHNVTSKPLIYLRNKPRPTNRRLIIKDPDDGDKFISAARPEPLFPQPKALVQAGKCDKRKCRLPDCRCGGSDIPGDLPAKQIPQIVMLTFDDAVNDLNWELYEEILNNGRLNPNGCPIKATFYVSHEWTDYGQVQSLYSRGHEIASHTISHRFGEKFSKDEWIKEINGQREILHLYGGVRFEDIRGMRAPFLQTGGNSMFEMLYEANFTYDSSLPVQENHPPYWPYTLDYSLSHSCNIPPCPTKSFPGVWEVGMVMWSDLRGGRCSMGDACTNPADEAGVYEMLIKNFNRHYKTNRAPFSLYYHSAWFNTQHHKKGFMKFLDEIMQNPDVYLVTTWQMLQWVRQPTPLDRLHSFQPFQCNKDQRPVQECIRAKVCNVHGKQGQGSRTLRTCQECPNVFPWIGNTGFSKSKYG